MENVIKNINHKKFRFLLMTLICALSLAFFSFTIELNDDPIRQNVYTSVDNNYLYADLLEKSELPDNYVKNSIYDEYIDNIVGIIFYKDFYQAEKENFKLENIIKEPMYVLKHKLVKELLKDFQANKQHFAVVADEFGSVAGIVTMEDILEEIVGEIWDEYDEIFEEIKQVSENVYIISGKTNVDKVFELFDITKELETVTVNGWISSELKSLPIRGTKLDVENLHIEVIKMKGKRIDSIKVTVHPKEEIEE